MNARPARWSIVRYRWERAVMEAHRRSSAPAMALVGVAVLSHVSAVPHLGTEGRIRRCRRWHRLCFTGSVGLRDVREHSLLRQGGGDWWWRSTDSDFYPTRILCAVLSSVVHQLDGDWFRSGTAVNKHRDQNNHSNHRFVDGYVHAQSLECFGSLWRRWRFHNHLHTRDGPGVFHHAHRDLTIDTYLKNMEDKAILLEKEMLRRTWFRCRRQAML